MAFNLQQLWEKPVTKKREVENGKSSASKRSKSSTYGINPLQNDPKAKTDYRVTHVYYESPLNLTKEQLNTTGTLNKEHVCGVRVTHKKSESTEQGDFALAVRLIDNDGKFLGYKPLGYKQEMSLLPTLDFGNDVCVTGDNMDIIGIYRNRLPITPDLEDKRHLIEGVGFVSDQHLKKFLGEDIDWTPTHGNKLRKSEPLPYFPQQLLDSGKMPEIAETLATDKFLPDDSLVQQIKETPVAHRTNRTYVASAEIVAQADLVKQHTGIVDMEWTGPPKKPEKEKKKEDKKAEKKEDKKAEKKKEDKKAKKEEKKADKKKEDKKAEKKQESKKKPEPKKVEKKAENPNPSGQWKCDFVHMNAYTKMVELMRTVKPAIAAKYNKPGSYIELLTAEITPIQCGSLNTNQQQAFVVLYELIAQKLGIVQLGGGLSRSQLLFSELDWFEGRKQKMRFIDAVGYLLSKSIEIGVPEFALTSELHLGDAHDEEYEATLKRVHTTLIFNLVNDAETLFKKDPSAEEASVEEDEDPFLA